MKMCPSTQRGLRVLGSSRNYQRSYLYIFFLLSVCFSEPTSHIPELSLILICIMTQEIDYMFSLIIDLLIFLPSSSL